LGRSSRLKIRTRALSGERERHGRSVKNVRRDRAQNGKMKMNVRDEFSAWTLGRRGVTGVFDPF
jgi:hypothetical protein